MSLQQPVKYPVKHYSWQDADAPQLTDADGVIKTILKACLVTGYGSKAAAGWVMSDEEGNNMTITPPHPTAVSITVHNSANDHRFVFTNIEVNMQARGRTPDTVGQEWHLFATDFAVFFIYQVTDNGHKVGDIKYQTCLYLGKMMALDGDNFFVNTHSRINKKGVGELWTANSPLNTTFKDVLTNKNYTQKHRHSIAGNDNLIIQPVILDKVAIMPFYVSLYGAITDHTTKQVNIRGRKFFRCFVNNQGVVHNNIAYYVPLDYWEL